MASRYGSESEDGHLRDRGMSGVVPQGNEVKRFMRRDQRLESPLAPVTPTSRTRTCKRTKPPRHRFR
jgi:hypothetical protein